MLEAVSCWKWDWTAIGAVATAAATISGVVVATQAYRTNKRRHDAWMAAAAVGLVVDIGGVAQICRNCVAVRGLYTNAENDLFKIREVLRVHSTKQFLQMQGDISPELALAASEFSVMAEMLGRNLDKNGMSSNHFVAAAFISTSAELTLEKSLSLAQALVNEYPSTKAALDSTLALQG